MAITLASDAFSDAEITDGIGRGDLASATRLWVRHWQGALAAAQQFVEPAEVPGLAAEALIGTIAAIAIGRGPREDVAGFVSAAVRELGEDDEPVTAGDPVPVVFVSAGISAAFAELDDDLQRDLRDAATGGRAPEDTVAALTVLQHYYLAEHTDKAPSQACRRTHIALMSAADGSAREGLAGATWLHLSTCAWCTEAFHEVAFSNVALGALIDPAVLGSVPAAAPAVAVIADPLTDPFEDTVAWEDPSLAAASPRVVPVGEEPPVVRDDLLDEDEDDDRRRGALLLSGMRGRMTAAALATVAAVAALVLVLGGQSGGDDGAPAAARTDGSESATPTPSAVVDPSFGAPTTPSTSPTQSPSVAGPLATTAATATAAATSGATSAPKPTKKPTKKPAAPKPTPSAAPTPTAAPTTTEPTPTPTATPTKNCNPLQQLLGFCRR